MQISVHNNIYANRHYTQALREVCTVPTQPSKCARVPLLTRTWPYKRDERVCEHRDAHMFVACNETINFDGSKEYMKDEMIMCRQKDDRMLWWVFWRCRISNDFSFLKSS